MNHCQQVNDIVCGLVAHIANVRRTLSSSITWRDRHGDNIVILLSCLSRLAQSYSSVSELVLGVVKEHAICCQPLEGHHALAFGLAQKWLRGYDGPVLGQDVLMDSGRDATVANVALEKCTDTLCLNYLAQLAQGNECRVQKWVLKGFKELVKRWDDLRQPLVFRGKYAQPDSQLRFYFVTHVVLMATAYGTRAPRLGANETILWENIAGLLCSWIQCMGEVPDRILGNVEVFFQASYVLMYMHRLHPTRKVNTDLLGVLRIIAEARNLIEECANRKMEQGIGIGDIPVQRTGLFQRNRNNVFMESLSRCNIATIADYHGHVILAFFLVEFERLVEKLDPPLKALHINTDKQLRPWILGLCLLLDANHFECLSLAVDAMSLEVWDRACSILTEYLEFNPETRARVRIKKLIALKNAKQHETIRAIVASCLPCLTHLHALIIADYVLYVPLLVYTPQVGPEDFLTCLTTPQ